MFFPTKFMIPIPNFHFSLGRETVWLGFNNPTSSGVVSKSAIKGLGSNLISLSVETSVSHTDFLKKKRNRKQSMLVYLVPGVSESTPGARLFLPLFNTPGSFSIWWFRRCGTVPTLSEGFVMPTLVEYQVPSKTDLAKWILRMLSKTVKSFLLPTVVIRKVVCVCTAVNSCTKNLIIYFAGLVFIFSKEDKLQTTA